MRGDTAAPNGGDREVEMTSGTFLVSSWEARERGSFLGRWEGTGRVRSEDRTGELLKVGDIWS